MSRVLLLCALMAGAAHGADFSDPTWPCVQRKVERLSLGVMWPDPAAAPPALSPEASELAARLALRRITLAEAEALIDAYAGAHPQADRAEYGAIFAEAFKRLDRQRTRLVQGIGRYSESQIALAARIDGARDQFAAAEAVDPPDYDKLDALEARIDWDERIHRDRQKALTYVCETPVLVEKRLYALAQKLQAAAE